MPPLKIPIMSYSALSKADKCPRQYHEVRILKRFPYMPGPEAQFGDAAHEALEMALIKFNTGQKPVLPAPFTGYQWVVDDLFPLLPDHAEPEHRFDFTAEWVPCGEKDWRVRRWTGLADILAWVNQAHALVVDYKTGKSGFPDVDQLELMALFTFVHYPMCQTVDAKLLFLNDAKVVDYQATRLADFDWLKAKWEGKMNNVIFRLQSGAWEEAASPLCPWCPVKECSNWRPPPVKAK